MTQESASNFQQHHYQQQQQSYPHQHRNHTDNVLGALKLAAAATFYSNASSGQSPTTSIGTQPALHPITTTIPSPVHLTRPSNPIDHLPPKVTSTRGPNKPLTLQQQGHTAYTGAQPSPHSAQFRSQHHHQISSLPSPPLSSVEPPLNSNFFPKSPVQERCEALEMELSTLRLRLKQFERSSTVREKRMSFFQQQTSDTQQSLQATTYQFESTISRLQDTEQRLEAAKASLSQNEEIVRQLEKTTHDQKCKLDEILSERESLAAEMKDSYAENVKLQKRLKTSTEKVEKLQQENRQLIEQLQNIRHGSTENHDSKSRIGDQAIIEIEKEVNKNKTEVNRLQNLVLMMSNRHVQVQAQLTFFQQQAQQLQLQLDQSHQESTSDRLNYNNDNNTPVPHWTNPTTTTTTTTTTARKHGSLMMDESTLSSLLTSVASVAATSHSRRTKPTRRYTVNAPRKDGELTLEQRKCEFLMDQISVLQRGYDALRQEKVTLELQIDLMQRQHQYHQQQRQKRRESQRRTLGQEQSKALSNALAIMVTSSPVSPGPLSAIPSTPLLPTISAAEQEKEKARIQYELEQAQIKAQQEAQEREAQRLAAKAAAEEAEKEAIRLKRAKSLHLKETLASLESKRDRTDSRNILFSKSEELKHLEHFRLANDLQQSDFRSSTDSTKSFSNAAAIRASRRVASPFSPGTRSSSNTSSPLSSSSPSPFSAITTPSPLSSHSSQEKQLAKYTHSSKNQQALHHLPSHAYKIEQCSCCLGAMIEL